MSAPMRCCLFAALVASASCIDMLMLNKAANLKPPATENGTAGEAAAASPPAGRSNRREMRERSLVNSLRHLGEWGATAVSCVSHCRYGEVKHAWKVCLDRCVDNPLLHSTFLNMLPEEQPDDLKAKAKSVLNRKLLLSRARHSEL